MDDKTKLEQFNKEHKALLEEVSKYGMTDDLLDKFHKLYINAHLILILGPTAIFERSRERPDMADELDIKFYSSAIDDFQKDPDFLKDEVWGKAKLSLGSVFYTKSEVSTLNIAWENVILVVRDSENRSEFDKKINGYVSMISILLGLKSPLWNFTVF